MNYQVPQIEWQDQYKLDQNKVETGNWHRSFSETLIHAYQIMESMTEQNKVMVHYYNKQTQKGEPYISCPNFNSVEEAKEWVETTHYPSALIKAGFKPVSEPLADTLIEKLEQLESSLKKDFIDAAIGFPYEYKSGKLNGAREAIDIVKQHEAESEVQDD